MKHIVHFDSGTSNTRGYLLDSELDLIGTAQKTVGSKDSAIAGSNRVLIDGLFDVYNQLLSNSGIKDDDVEAIYASGMITSPYGLKEVPHLVLPLTVQKFAENLYPHFEITRFQREIVLVPGLKTTGNEIDQINNMRGEEIELIGLMPRLNATYGHEPIAVVMPGSHTHIMLIRGERIDGVISNFTGELFFAIKNETILSPVLNFETDQYDSDSVRKGLENLKRYGFNRALYICHAMRLFNNGTPLERISYAEGVILGGISQSLEYYCRNEWSDVKKAVVVAKRTIGKVYQDILNECDSLESVDLLEISEENIPALDGMRGILAVLKKG